LLAGLETDVAGVRTAGKASLWTAIGGVLMPLGFGAVAGHLFGLTWPQAIFLGTVLTATSVSISAQTLRESVRFAPPKVQLSLVQPSSMMCSVYWSLR
jgi:Kef-type K+ transport system membrane component KefB